MTGIYKKLFDEAKQHYMNAQVIIARYAQIKNLMENRFFVTGRDVAVSGFDELLQFFLFTASLADGVFTGGEATFINEITETADILGTMSSRVKRFYIWVEMTKFSFDDLQSIHAAMYKYEVYSAEQKTIKPILQVDMLKGTNFWGELKEQILKIVKCFIMATSMSQISMQVVLEYMKMIEKEYMIN